MATITTQALGPTETQVMNIVWAHNEPVTVRQVHRLLAARDLAYTTVMTTIDRLTEKGILIRGDLLGPGGAYLYLPALSRGALLAGAVEQMCQLIGAEPRDRAEALAALGASSNH